MTAAELRKELGLPPADFAPIPGQAKHQVDKGAAGEVEIEVEKPKRRKFGENPCWYKSPMNGLRRYDSQKEARRAEKLDLLVAGNQVLAWWPQWPADCGFDNEDGSPARMMIDFRVLWSDGRVTYEDVKGYEPTEAWKVRRRAVRSHMGIEVEIV